MRMLKGCFESSRRSFQRQLIAEVLAVVGHVPVVPQHTSPFCAMCSFGFGKPC